jgi:hypothetical protein
VLPDSYEFVLLIPDIVLQSSSKDAGEWSVTTKDKYSDGGFYAVDTMALSESFTATPGAVTA